MSIAPVIAWQGTIDLGAQAYVQQGSVANRGEIAVRILRACRELGSADGGRLSPKPTARPCTCAMPTRPTCSARRRRASSYLRIDKITRHRAPVRRRRHPSRLRLPGRARGFRRAPAKQAGIAFIGPRPSAIAAMGDKMAARATVAAAGIPVVPGTEGEGDLSDEELIAHRPADRLSRC